MIIPRACKEITCSMNFKKQRPNSPFFFEKEQVIPLLRLNIAQGRKMGKLQFKETGLEGLWLIEPTVFGDSRGFFMECPGERVYVDGI